jgi:hypothetical protein
VKNPAYKNHTVLFNTCVNTRFNTKHFHQKQAEIFSFKMIKKCKKTNAATAPKL